jgi:hypothetical protein
MTIDRFMIALWLQPVRLSRTGSEAKDVALQLARCAVRFGEKTGLLPGITNSARFTKA